MLSAHLGEKKRLSQSPSLLISGSGGRPQRKGLLSPVACQIYWRNFSPVGFSQSQTVFSGVPSINPDHATWNITSAVMIQIQIKTMTAAVLYFLTAGCINSVILCSISPLYHLYLNTKQSALCSIKLVMESYFKTSKMLANIDSLQWKGCVFVSTSREQVNRGKSLTLLLMFSIYNSMGKETKFSPLICLVVVPSIACLLALDSDPSIWSFLEADR